MRRTGMLVLALVLAGCSPPPTSSTPATGVGAIGSRLAGRTAAPSTRNTDASAGPLWKTNLSGAGSGRSGTVVTQRMTIQLDSGPLGVDCTLIEPGSIPSVPQRYSNDCAQAAIATVASYYGFGGSDPYLTVSSAMAPLPWGTRLEDVVAYLGGIQAVSVTPRPKSTFATLKSLTSLGKPVPVVISLSDTQMHYMVVIGTGVSPAGQDLVLFRDPSRPAPTDMGVLDAETFDGAWANTPIRTSWWNWLARTFDQTNTANYERIALDVGAR